MKQKRMLTKQVGKILEDLTGLLTDYIEECEQLPSKFECDECGRNSAEHFTCNCHAPKVCEYKECPVCGEWIDVDDEEVWECCMSDRVIDESDLEDQHKEAFLYLMKDLLKKAKAKRPINKSLDDVMIDVMCDAYEDEASLKSATEFVNGIIIK